MNKEFMLKTAKYLEKLPRNQFHMENFFCGTTACIAGHMCLLGGYIRTSDEGSLVDKGSGSRHAEAVAKELSGLDEEQVNDLFYDFSLNTPKQAATKIREMVKEGA